MTRQLSQETTVEQFMEVAWSYCAVIDEYVESELRDICKELEPLLPQLVVSVQGLPYPYRPGPLTDTFDHTWKPIRDALAERLGEHRRYWTVFDPRNPTNDDPVVGDLADDLADIYCDLRRGLYAWEVADVRTCLGIIWAWKHDYEWHWGQRAVDAHGIISHLRKLTLAR